VDHRINLDCKKIDGFWSMHFMAFVSHLNNTLLNVRDLAFICLECMDNNFDFCNAQAHVMPWRLNHALHIGTCQHCQDM
jgi:hypothetical protein